MNLTAGIRVLPEAERCLMIAVNLLGMRDLERCMHFVNRAFEYDPFLDGVDEVRAVADVLLAGQRRVNNHVDWYAVLRLPHPSRDGSDVPDGPSSLDAVERQYVYFAQLLQPARNKNPGADCAFKLVSHAFAVLSNPVMRSLFDAELRVAAAAPVTARYETASVGSSSNSGGLFWTACPSCFHLHQYAREYVNLWLRCPSCRRPFFSSELASPPTIVPGSDMYQCAWGCFPPGYPDGPKFYFDANCGPQSASRRPANVHSRAGTTVQEEDAVQPQPATPSGRNKKRMAQKRAGRPPTGSAISQQRLGSGARPSGRSEEKGDVDINLFTDIDVADEIVGDLQDAI